MIFIVSHLVRRNLPTALNLAARTTLARGITAGIFSQPITLLLPVLWRMVRGAGFASFVASPLSNLIPANSNLSIRLIYQLVVSGVIYRLGAICLKALILYPFRMLFIDLLGSKTPLANYGWFKDFNIFIYKSLKVILKSIGAGVDESFSFAIQHSTIVTVVLAIAGCMTFLMKYQDILEVIGPIFRNYFWNVLTLANLEYVYLKIAGFFHLSEWWTNHLMVSAHYIKAFVVEIFKASFKTIGFLLKDVIFDTLKLGFNVVSPLLVKFWHIWEMTIAIPIGFFQYFTRDVMLHMPTPVQWVWVEIYRIWVWIFTVRR